MPVLPSNPLTFAVVTHKPLFVAGIAKGRELCTTKARSSQVATLTPRVGCTATAITKACCWPLRVPPKFPGSTPIGCTCQDVRLSGGQWDSQGLGTRISQAPPLGQRLLLRNHRNSKAWHLKRKKKVETKLEPKYGNKFCLHTTHVSNHIVPLPNQPTTM